MTDNKYMFEKTGRTIEDYPENTVILADIVRLADNKTELLVLDSDGNTLYNNRCEYIKWTTEGCASSLYDRKITDMDVTSDGKLVLYVDRNL